MNGPLSRLTGGTIQRAAISADGLWAVYVADAHTIGVFELYSVPMKGGSAPIRISGPLEDFAGSEFAISPDSRYVLYRDTVNDLYRVGIDRSSDPLRLVDSAVTGSFEFTPDGADVVFTTHEPGLFAGLYVVPVDLSAPPLELVPQSALGGVQHFQLSPDGTRIVFASGDANGINSKLYSVPIAGGAAVLLYEPTVPYEGYNLAIAGDLLVFTVRVAGRERVLRSVPIDGSAASVRLDALTVPGTFIFGFEVSPDGAHVMYKADQEVAGRYEIYSVPSDGSAAPVKLNHELDPGALVIGAQIHPSGRWVMYNAGRLDSIQFQLFTELFAIPIEGNHEPIKLNAPLLPEGNVRWFGFAAGGSRVLYQASHAPSEQVSDLWSVSLTHGLPKVKLAETTGFLHQQVVSPDGSHLLYRSPDGLNSLSVDGSAPTEVLVHAAASFQVSPDGSRVLYTLSLAEMFSVPIDGGKPVKLNGPLAPGELVSDVASFQVSADGESLVFHSNGLNREEDSDVDDELYAVAADGSAAPLRLVPNGVAYEADIIAYELAPDSQRVVLLTGDMHGEFDDYVLTSVTLDGAAMRLNPYPEFVRRFAISRTGDRVVYVSLVSGENDEYLKAVALDGSSSAYPLAADPVGGGAVNFQIAPDGERVVFLAMQISTKAELFSVPMDASAAPVRLNTDLAGQKRIRSFAIDALSQRVVYIADQETVLVDEVWSAPIDGSAPPTKLNGVMVGGGDVTAYALGPDGTSVFYRADQDVNDVVELYRAPIAGGAAPTKLSGTLVAGGDVEAMRVSADGSRVAFIADALTNGVVELFAVPALGGSSPVRLNGALVAGGNVGQAFQLTRDSLSAVYTADALTDERVELFAVPLDGSSSPRKLSGPLHANGDVDGVFRISPDSRTVAYAADARTDEVVELFAATLDGTRPLERLSGVPVSGGDVTLEAFQFHPDSDRIYYVADQEIDDVQELLLSFAGVPHRRAPAAPGD